MMTYRSAGEKVAEEAKHFHDDVHLRVGKQTEQVITAEGTQHLWPQLLFTAEGHVLEAHSRQSLVNMSNQSSSINPSISWSINCLINQSFKYWFIQRLFNYTL